MPNIILRGRTWYLKRRVPKRYASVEGRPVLWESLKTDLKSVALGKAERVWAGYIEGWEALLAGATARPRRGSGRPRISRPCAGSRSCLRHRWPSARCRRYWPGWNPLARPTDTRTLSWLAAGVLGGVEEPKLMLSELVARDETISAHDNRFKSTQKMRLWRNPRKRAVANLVAALGGDRPVVEVSSAEARQRKRWWQARIAEEGQSAQTVNKDFNYLAGMLARFYDDIDHPDPPRPYAGVSLKDRHAKIKRKDEVPVAYIAERWLAPGAFDGLNDEARDILLSPSRRDAGRARSTTLRRRRSSSTRRSRTSWSGTRRRRIPRNGGR